MHSASQMLSCYQCFDYGSDLPLLMHVDQRLQVNRSWKWSKGSKHFRVCGCVEIACDGIDTNTFIGSGGVDQIWESAQATKLGKVNT